MLARDCGNSGKWLLRASLLGPFSRFSSVSALFSNFSWKAREEDNNNTNKML